MNPKSEFSFLPTDLPAKLNVLKSDGNTYLSGVLTLEEEGAGLVFTVAEPPAASKPLPGPEEAKGATVGGAETAAPGAEGAAGAPGTGGV